MILEEFFNCNIKAALAFSGGVDSAFLLYAVLKYGAKFKAYFIKMLVHPNAELDNAINFAGRIGCELEILHVDILSTKKVVENTGERCYWCKRSMFTILREKAIADGYILIIDETNATDEEICRPGMRALRELVDGLLRGNVVNEN